MPAVHARVPSSRVGMVTVRLDEPAWVDEPVSWADETAGWADGSAGRRGKRAAPVAEPAVDEPAVADEPAAWAA
ncbi:hypothetical protein, partial [Amycolatopsis sp. SID8362]|uniref:hypothetical protein n=1 Tax=Amycolatopsis sp. SID8362 TaxID=2690346 RepID=UPI001942720A